MFIDLYAIQNVPPSNINRDDTGSPKTAVYGGALRARVSSQAWKRAMRVMFAELLPDGSLGVRTKLAVGLLAQRIADVRQDLAGVASEYAAAALSAVGIKVKPSARKGEDNQMDETGYLLFISQREIEELAGIAINWADSGVDAKKVDKARKKEVSDVFKGQQAVDIALFGRMLADAPDFNVDASAQVAHAISVDRITQEYDYFTAVDDCTSDDNAGAGMIGTVDFNSSTLYRYATVNIDSLLAQLGDTKATVGACRAFMEAFIRSMPSGKQNTFANRTLPGTVCVALRSDQPINAVGAFEKPVRPSEDASITQCATKSLSNELSKVEKTYAQPAAGKWYLTLEDLEGVELAGLGERMDFASMIDAASARIDAYLGAGEER